MPSLYVYNLGISLQPPNTTNGSFFSPSNTGLMQSGVWFQWNPQMSLPVWLSDNVFLVPNPLVASYWINPQPDTNPITVNDTDFVLIRTFLSDTPVPTNCQMRLTVVFGKGVSGPDNVNSTPLQTPLQLTSNGLTLPRTLVDTDNALPTQAPAGDNSWTYCIGMIHGAGNNYSFNVGATLLQNSSQLYTFGHDPQLKVKGMTKQRAA